MDLMTFPLPIDTIRSLQIHPRHFVFSLQYQLRYKFLHSNKIERNGFDEEFVNYDYFYSFDIIHLQLVTILGYMFSASK
jgi:hypothetical protein